MAGEKGAEKSEDKAKEVSQEEKPAVAKAPTSRGVGRKEKKPARTPKTRRKKTPVPEGMIYIQSTFNNTVITVTDLSGQVVASSSCGHEGFKGSRKSTPYAASITARHVAEKAQALGMNKATIFVKGVGVGRDSAIRAIAGSGIEIVSIKDLTPTPHNGPRAKKPRRV